MSTHKLLISDGMSSDGLSILEDSGLFEISLHKGLEEAELIKMLPEYAAIIIRSATKLKGEKLAAGTNLRAIMRAGSGVDNIDVPKASEMDIAVFNTPGANNNAVVELSLGFMFSLLREIPRATSGMKAGKWEKKELTGQEMEGRTLGILGLGAIGASVARKAAALGMTVIGYDPRANELDLGSYVSETCANIDDVFAKASMVSVHMPLMDATKNSIGSQQFQKMTKGSYLVNCSRGGIVNEADLLAALNDGTLAGAALDVFESEPVPADSALVNHPGVICSPHVGAATKESQSKVAKAAAEGLIRCFKNSDRSFALNKDQLK